MIPHPKHRLHDVATIPTPLAPECIPYWSCWNNQWLDVSWMYDPKLWTRLRRCVRNASSSHIQGLSNTCMLCGLHPLDRTYKNMIKALILNVQRHNCDKFAPFFQGQTFGNASLIVIFDLWFGLEDIYKGLQTWHCLKTLLESICVSQVGSQGLLCAFALLALKMPRWSPCTVYGNHLMILCRNKLFTHENMPRSSLATCSVFHIGSWRHPITHTWY